MKETDVRIVVVAGGFVFVGEYEEKEKYVHLSATSCIRRWGTTKGLGELVNGPTKETILDPAGLVSIPIGQMLFNIKCSSKWPL